MVTFLWAAATKASKHWTAPSHSCSYFTKTTEAAPHWGRNVWIFLAENWWEGKESGQSWRTMFLLWLLENCTHFALVFFCEWRTLINVTLSLLCLSLEKPYYNLEIWFAYISILVIWFARMYVTYTFGYTSTNWFKRRKKTAQYPTLHANAWWNFKKS